ncbi:MAG: 50S ribosomal protein L10 [Candidatus Lambdaproteobacteria bacterium RIFOXYD1_FULL_56_27]|uniref:Large ribosomal subunit protein uL10 n=1 Tax=Candidatus Lambdaproteobacteria bacterium RIFOXYD2_FULL_56_26 TaxID=1817773 RepID=A0A1F6GVF3_9PROT|nr:MAG: 50S ribosomal protein L10 [Candidatus Lambdaproteobacteria bacterium RIFOXYD2_FULL_56_26]OGH03309.1 MAG: 50S ribosomal protein L10 [Candidatus Lambdaproteobacteria bacterium RIFOXYC1_FULL_56_13]OGH07494.1 MAG: 50S ribosomal protein L10 [Candidatus Lambdaproteobacteria bacterium RIFOXYD1_FULL_56_27]
MDRSQKEQLVAEFGDIFKKAQSGVLVDYQGIGVESLTSLRKSLFAQGSRVRVIKNTLAKIASKGTPYEALSKEFVQTRAIVYTEKDAVSQAKVMTEAVKTNDKLKIVAGLLVTGGQGKLLSAKDVDALSKLPSREELLTKLLFVMNAPATNFVRTLNEVPTSFVRCVKAIAESKS